MNRLQKKCFIASTGIHLLIAITLLAPTLMSSPSKAVDMPVLEFIPDLLTDKPFSGGGNPNAKPPPRIQPEPIKPPQPVVTQTKPLPEPPKEEPKPPKPDPEALEPAPKKPKIQIDPTRVVRKNNSKTTPKKSPAPDTRELEMADTRRRVSDLIQRTAGSLREDLSSSTSFEMPGTGGGQAYANYGQVVTSIYQRMWIAPEDAANDAAITKATVTIASDGTVLSARIIRPCGDSSVDNSVQRTLDRVTFIAPFPEGAKEKQRTYTINFNLKARRLLG
jgi:TonB family protein